MLIITFGTLTNYCTSECCYKRELVGERGGRRREWEIKKEEERYGDGGEGTLRVDRKSKEWKTAPMSVK